MAASLAAFDLPEPQISFDTPAGPDGEWDHLVLLEKLKPGADADGRWMVLTPSVDITRQARHNISPLVDEADRVTAEVRKDQGERLRFGVHTLMHLFTQTPFHLELATPTRSARPSPPRARRPSTSTSSA